MCWHLCRCKLFLKHSLTKKFWAVKMRWVYQMGWLFTGTNSGRNQFLFSQRCCQVILPTMWPSVLKLMPELEMPIKVWRAARAPSQSQTAQFSTQALLYSRVFNQNHDVKKPSNWHDELDQQEWSSNVLAQVPTRTRRVPGKQRGAVGGFDSIAEEAEEAEGAEE